MNTWKLLLSFACLSLPLLASAQPADLVVHNGKVVTVDSKFTLAEAVAISGGKFAFVGTTKEARRWIGEKTRVIDAQGKTVIPGLIESHVHATGAARGEVEQPFVQLGSIGEIQKWLRERAVVAPAHEWIRLPRVDVTRIRERRMPTRADLDAAAPTRPAVFNWQYANRQIQILNSAALKAAGIDKDTKAPDKGTIHRDAAGELTGVLEDCGTLTAKFLPRANVSDLEYLDSLEKLLRRYNGTGITGIFERGSNLDGVRTFNELKSLDRLPVRVTVTVRIGSDGTPEGAEKAIRALPAKTGDGDDWVRVGPLKISVDGGVLYGTAFLREPYGKQALGLYGLTDPEFRGLLQTTPEKVKNIIRAGHRLGWQMSCHVTGDAGVDAVLDAVEAAHADSPITDRRFTLIHAYFANEDTAQRAARLGVCVDTQPAWYYQDGDALADALGGKRLEKFIGLNVWRTAGVKVALNSDHMQGFGPQTALNPFDPFLTMYVAISRKTATGLVIGPEQKVSREAALRMMTIDAAYLGFAEQRQGSIEVGKLGDLAILTDDFLTCPEERIKQIRAAITVVDGKVVYESG